MIEEDLRNVITIVVIYIIKWEIHYFLLQQIIIAIKIINVYMCICV